MHEEERTVAWLQIKEFLRLYTCVRYTFEVALVCFYTRVIHDDNCLNGGIGVEEQGNANYRGMMQPSQQQVAPCVKGIEWGLGTTGQVNTNITW